MSDSDRALPNFEEQVRDELKLDPEEFKLLEKHVIEYLRQTTFHGLLSDSDYLESLGQSEHFQQQLKESEERAETLEQNSSKKIMEAFALYLQKYIEWCEKFVGD